MNKKSPILEVIRQGMIGGGETHVLELSKRLDQRVYEPVVLSFTNGPMIDQLNALGIENHIISTEQPFDIRVWGKVKQLIRKRNIKLVHAHGTRAMSNVYWVANKLKLPLIYTVHGWSFHDDQVNWKKHFRILSEQYLCNKSDVTINVSEANRQQGINLFNNFASLVINNGIDLDKFDPASADNGFRKEIGIPEDVTLVSFIARLTKQKDPLTLIHAFKKVLEYEQNIMLLIVGEGTLEEETRRLVVSYKITDHVRFLPFRQDVAKILKAIDIYCLPSLWEGLSIGLLEVMAMGKAIIATDVESTKEIIQDNTNGMLIRPGNTQALAEKILLLHRDKNLRSSLAKASGAIVVEKFNINDMVREIEKVYLSLLK